jgi:hypothetical protein
MAGQATDHQANGKVTIFHLKATKNPKILWLNRQTNQQTFHKCLNK